MKSLTKIGGTSGYSEYKIVANYIMKHCFHISILQEFTFSSVSKQRNMPSFTMYTSIIRFLFEIIYLADKSFTVIKMDEYLKNYFKKIRGKKNLKKTCMFSSDADTESADDYL